MKPLCWYRSKNCRENCAFFIFIVWLWRNTETCVHHFMMRTFLHVAILSYEEDFAQFLWFKNILVGKWCFLKYFLDAHTVSIGKRQKKTLFIHNLIKCPSFLNRGAHSVVFIYESRLCTLLWFSSYIVYARVCSIQSRKWWSWSAALGDWWGQRPGCVNKMWCAALGPHSHEG